MVALCSLLGCRAAAVPPGASFGPERPQHPPDTLVVGLPAEPSTLDPARCNESACSGIVQNLFAGLVRLEGAELTPVGDLAERWHETEGGRVLGFRLRDTRWSDGRPLSANDVVHSVHRTLAPETAAANAPLLDVIDGACAFRTGTGAREAVGVRALGPREVEFRLRQPAPWFLQLLAHSAFRPVPAHVAAQAGAPADWPAPGDLVTSGPFRVARWRFRRDVDLVRQPGHFWPAASGPARVRLAFVPQADSAMALYEYGALDLLGTQVPAAWLPRVARARDLSLTPQLTSHYFWLNHQRPPLDDVRVRQALGLALDRQRLVARLLRGRGRPASTFVPPSVGGQPAAAAGRADVPRARALLAEAGFPGGRGMRPLVLSFNADDSHRQLAEAVQAMWQATLGVRVRLEQKEWRVFLHEMAGRQFDIARMGWMADYADARSFLRDVFASGEAGTEADNNYSGWHDARFDELLARAERQDEPAARARLFGQAEALMLAAAPLLPLYFGVGQTLSAPYVAGDAPTPLGPTPWHLLRLTAPARGG